MACFEFWGESFWWRGDVGGGVFGWVGVEGPLFPHGGGPMEAAKFELVGGQLESKEGGARARTCSLTRR